TAYDSGREGVTTLTLDVSTPRVQPALPKPRPPAWVLIWPGMLSSNPAAAMSVGTFHTRPRVTSSKRLRSPSSMFHALRPKRCNDVRAWAALAPNAAVAWGAANWP